MRKRFLSIILVVLAVVMVYSHALALDAVLPKGIKIVPPGPDIPRDIGRLSGMWGGTMETTGANSQEVDQKLAVEEVEKKADKYNARLIYCWGDNFNLRVDGSCIKPQAVITLKEGVVSVSFENPMRHNATLIFVLNQEKDILEAKGERSRIKLKRFQQNP